MTDFIRVVMYTEGLSEDLKNRLLSLLTKVQDREGRPAHNIIVHTTESNAEIARHLANTAGVGYSLTDIQPRVDYYIGDKKHPATRRMIKSRVPRHII